MTASDRGGHRRLIEGALDLLIFAPVGIAAHAATHLPEVIAEGRHAVLGSVGNAQRAARNVGTVGGAYAAQAASKVAGQGGEAQRMATGALDHILPGYDNLSASQVIRRLETLSADELREVGAAERAGRGRQTVLGAVAARLGELEGDGGTRGSQG